MGSFSIQQLLVTWILVGVLHESPERVGMAQLLIGIPGLIFMLWGGAIGDRVDGRKLLIQAHYLSAIPPLLLAVASFYGLIGFWILIMMALAANLLNSGSNPARNTILNRVAASRLQYAISLSTGIGSIATMAGTKFAGELETLGLTSVLIGQALLFVIGGIFTSFLTKGPAISRTRPTPALQVIRDGLAHVWHHKLARDVIGINCLSSFFNAGAWMVAMPFVIARVYAGDAILLANLTVVFYFGSLVANFGLLRFMPLLRPGRLFLLMQLSRIPILVLIWLKPELWVIWFAVAFWGFNMGVTSTMSRLMVQEFSDTRFLSRVMSIYTLSLMSAAPIGSLVLGFIIGIWGPLNALLPGMLASTLIFVFGYYKSAIWDYRSPA